MLVDSSRQSIGSSRRWWARMGMGLGITYIGCVQAAKLRSEGAVLSRRCAIPLILVLVSLVTGVYLVAAARPQPRQAERLDRIGGALVVLGLIGLGFILASRRYRRSTSPAPRISYQPSHRGGTSPSRHSRSNTNRDGAQQGGAVASHGRGARLRADQAVEERGPLSGARSRQPSSGPLAAAASMSASSQNLLRVRAQHAASMIDAGLRSPRSSLP